MDDKVKELVEWVANTITGFGCGVQANWDGCGDCESLLDGEKCQGAVEVAKIILSHPDLALIDYNKRDLEGYPTIIPLAEALKEVQDEDNIR